MKTRISWRDAQVPSLTETYSPVAHSELIYLIEKQLEADGYSVRSNHTQGNWNGEQMSGSMMVSKDGYGGDFSQTVAYMNSYNKRLPVRLASGARAFICENGMIIGEIISLRKHTGEVFPVLKEMIASSIAGMDASFEKTQSDVAKMKEFDLTKTMAAELVGRMYIEERILNSNEVNELARQLRKPTFEDFKPNNPDRQMGALKQLHEFAMDVTNEMLIHV